MATVLTPKLVEAAKRLSDEYLRSAKAQALTPLEQAFERALARWLADLRRKIILATVEPVAAKESMIAWRAMDRLPRFLILAEAGGSIPLNFEDKFADLFKSAEDAYMGYNNDYVAKAFEEGYAANKEALFTPGGMGQTGTGSFALQNPGAQAWAALRGAGLVKDINDATRSALRSVVSDARFQGQSYAELARRIAQMPEFDRARAKTIAVTETAMAYEHGSMAPAQILQDSGIEMEKEWLTHSQPCKICEPNKLQGWILFDSTFASGHNVAPAHPNCRCSVAYRRNKAAPSNVQPPAPPAPPPPPPAPVPGGAKSLTDILNDPEAIEWSMNSFGMSPEMALKLGATSQGELANMADALRANKAELARLNAQSQAATPVSRAGTVSEDPAMYRDLGFSETTFDHDAWGFRHYGSKSWVTTAEQQDALSYFQGSGYGVINADYKAGRTNITGRKVAEALSNAPAVPEDVILWRGATQASMKNKTVGDTIKRKMFTSTSTNERVAHDFLSGYMVEDRVLWRILTPKGTTGVGYVDATSGKMMTEAEMLFKNGVEWKIVADEKVTRHTRFGDKEVRMVTVVVVG